MIKLLVSLLLEFPSLADAVFKIRNEYIKAYKANRRSRMDKRIDDWLHHDSKE
jgi:hypothetical protein